mgnify:CR=1 FL=1
MQVLSIIVCIITLLIMLVGKPIFILIKRKESEEEFDVIYFQTEDMQPVESLENNDVAITQSFSIEKNGYKGELRYSLFTDCGISADDLMVQYGLWSYMCLCNASGYEVPSSEIAQFSNSDVKEEFNGDLGCTAFIPQPQSEYGSGYNFMMVEFFYKKGQGLVMRSFLFNDFEFLGMNSDGSILSDSALFSNYHTFKFMEKDENGKCIIE